MRYSVLATDYDNTIALHGIVSRRVVGALLRVRTSGRKLALVTGRTARELDDVFKDGELFDITVLENGAVLRLARGTERELAPRLPRELVEELRRRDVTPMEVGRCIISTAEPNAEQARAAIDRLGLDLRLVYNRDSVMVLGRDVDKSLGLRAACDELGADLSDVVAVGDGENDCAMLRGAGLGVAVENAVAQAKACADLVLTEPGPDGIDRLCSSLVDSDLDRGGSGSAAGFTSKRLGHAPG